MKIDFFTTEEFLASAAARYFDADLLDEVGDAVENGLEAGMEIEEIIEVILRDPTDNPDGIGWGDMGWWGGHIRQLADEEDHVTIFIDVH